MDRKCNTCGEIKPLDQFFKRDKISYFNRCKECEGKYQREYYRSLRKRGICTRCRKRKTTSTAACDECRIETRRLSREYNANVREEVLKAYGGRCAKCGETRLEVLTLDHIDGQGNEHRRRVKQNNMNYLLRAEGFPPGIQVLCGNCHLIKSRDEWKERRLPDSKVGTFINQ